jgi:hypothetical protein
VYADKSHGTFTAWVIVIALLGFVQRCSGNRYFPMPSKSVKGHEMSLRA